MIYFNIAAKQNQKFPFHFLSAPPTPPAEENKKSKENFWFLLPRPQGADEARIIGRQGSIQNTFELRSIHTAIFRKVVKYIYYYLSKQKCLKF